MYSKQSPEMGKSKKKGSKMKDLAKKYNSNQSSSSSSNVGSKKSNAIFSGKQILD